MILHNSSKHIFSKEFTTKLHFFSRYVRQK
jgi:hypothetical protein